MRRQGLRAVHAATLCAAMTALGGVVPAGAQQTTVKGKPITELLSQGGLAVHRAMLLRAAPRRAAAAVPGAEEEGEGDRGLLTEEEFFASFAPDATTTGGMKPGGNGRYRNVFVNDPCVDPPPPRIDRTVQSETEIAVLNRVRGAEGGDDADDDGASSGRLMVAGYNDSWGFYNNTQGLSGFAYTTDGGKSWIDGGGLPPIVKTGLPAGTPGQDAYFGDPVVAVHHRSKTFYYASIYLTPAGIFTIAVNRGHFKVAPPQTPESRSNTRCRGNFAAFGIPDPPPAIRERIIWEPPVIAVPIVGGAADDFIDKEWLYVDQRTGELYLVYVRFGADGGTPLELTRSRDGGRTWIGPTIIVPNLLDTFNTGLSVATTPTGRVIVSWYARTFQTSPPFREISDRIESAYSDNDGVTFSPPVIATGVFPQGEPPGYNRFRSQILDVTFLAVDKGKDDGSRADSKDEDDEDREGRGRSTYGNVYLSYFDGKPFPSGQTRRAGDIKLSTSTNNGASWNPPVKVNDDNTITSHVFPSVQVNKRGTVFVTWVDRRLDPVNNLLTDTWGAFSNDGGRSFDRNFRISDVSTDWFVRADAQPNFGDYNSSEVVDFDRFLSIWSDGRFPEGTYNPPRCGTPPVAPPPGQLCPARRAATPDVLTAIVGNGASSRRGDDDRSRSPDR
jgi:hypothetical protein